MSKVRKIIYLSLLLIFTTPTWAAQYLGFVDAHALHQAADSITNPIPEDSTKLNIENDSTILSFDSIPKPKKKSVLDDVVDYSAKDSIVLTSTNWGYLFGESEVTYGDINLKAEKISMSMDSNIVTATFGLDSVGEEFGHPIFNDKGTDYESKTMRYNFKTQKGYIRDVITEQGEGFVVAGQAKKNEDNSFFMTDGRYTTCDQHDHPHFYIKITKGKVQPKKNVVAGPAYLVIEGLPIPFIGLPFGFFPFTDKYSSGVIMPSFGDDLDKGFFLHNGGYYFAINDYVDLALTGEIYTKGSWGLGTKSTYRKRYKYSGSVDANYVVTKLGEKGIDYTESKDMRINWTHSQDPKANMYRTLSASVNFSTSKYNRNQLDRLGTLGSTENTKSSSVNLTQRIPNSPWSMSASMNIAQMTRDSSISLTLPNLTVTMSRIYPFKRKEAAGKEKWFEKIYMSYTGDFRNSLRTKEDSVFKASLTKDWRKGMKHSVPIGATFNLFDHFNITPTFNYNERWYTNKITKGWDDTRKTLVDRDTSYSFYRVYDFTFNVAVQTKLYGMYKPLIGKDKVKAIRHVFTPQIGFAYNPDFSDPVFGAYETYYYYDSYGDKKRDVYSPFDKEIFGSAMRGKQSLVTFSFDNNIEMKIKSDRDSTGERKISLVDKLGIAFNYNMAADSMKWSNINANIRFKFTKTLTVGLNGVFDTYMYDPIRDEKTGKITGLNRVDKLRLSNGKGFGRLMNTGYSLTHTINQDTFNKWFNKDSDDSKGSKGRKGNSLSDDEDEDDEEEVEEKKGSLFAKKTDETERDEDGYIINKVKWDFSFTYGMNYAYDQSRIDEKNLEYKRKMRHDFSFNGSIQPTKHWNIRFNANYDFDAKKISYSSFSLTRNLHCWAITASFTPVGPSKFFYVKVSASSQLLQDLKYETRKSSSSRDPEWD